MARKLTGRITVRGTLQAVDALHIGSGESNLTTDMAVACDGQGRVAAAGTGIAGALRAWCERRLDSATVDLLWGFQKADLGHASHLWTADAVIRKPDGSALMIDDLLEVRDHVGIDREFGAAAHHIKFDRAILPPGCLFDLELILDLPQQHASVFQAILHQMLQALLQQSIRMGAAKTRGLGRIRLLNDNEHELKIVRSDWSLAAICRKLQGQETLVPIDVLKQAGVPLPLAEIPRLAIRIDWTPRQPTMIKSSVDGLLVDTLPLIAGTGVSMAPVIPGSSLIGVLRSRAEMILRTVLNRDPHWRMQPDSKVRFLDQLDEDLPLIHQVFGSRGSRQQPDESYDDDSQAAVAIGALSIADCFSMHQNSPEAWADLTYASATGTSEPERYQAIQKGKEAVCREGWHVASHNAIDRWTSGVADNALYQVMEPHGEENWNPFELELDLARVASTREQQEAAFVLLMLTLRDLVRGRVPIGFGGNRGLGEVLIRGISVTPVEGDPVGVTRQVSMTGGWDLGIFAEDLRFALSQSWNTICDEAATAEETVHA